MTGDAALPNHVGIEINSAIIGGSTPEARNIITGNQAGIVLTGFGTAVIQGNYIGRTRSGADLGNLYSITLAGGPNVIGGTLPGEGNVIAGSSVGISLGGHSTVGDRIEGNLIVNNWSTGILLNDGAANHVIGGTAAGAGNTIAYNRSGIVVSRSTGGPNGEVVPGYPYAKNNRITGNSIFANTNLGIDLFGTSGEGVTPNDPLDADTGDNELQNFPELTAAASSAASTRVQGSLHSTPSSTFTLDFYANSATDPSGYGEGERYLGSAAVTTDASGNASFNALLSAPSTAGEFITATATDAVGNTSEFSFAIQSIPAVKAVALDIRAESLNVDSNHTLTVLVYGAADFDASVIDVGSVLFAQAHVWQSSLLDVNNDGFLDMQLKFRTQDTNLDEVYAQLLLDDEDEDGVLDTTRQTALLEVTGEMLDDALFSGSDSLTLFLAGRKLRDLLNELFG